MGTDVNRVVVVTGGSRGIGRAIALRMARPGTRTYLNYSSEDSGDADKAVRLIEDAGG